MEIIVFAYKDNLVAGEIIKNFALLGITKMKINNKALESYNKIGVNSLEEVNEMLTVELIQDIPETGVLVATSEPIDNNSNHHNTKANQVYDCGPEEALQCKINPEEQTSETDEITVVKAVSNVSPLDYDTKNLTDQDIVNLPALFIFVDFECDAQKKIKEREFYLCSDCLSFSKDYKHVCQAKTTGSKVALECLLGAMFVQEVVKMVNDEKATFEYYIDI